MSEFESFMALVLAPVELSCGSRGCHVEGDGAWSLVVETKVDVQAALEAA